MCYFKYSTMKNRIKFYRQDWDLDQYAQNGFENMQKAKYWKESCCGILCLKMILNSDMPSIADMIRTGIKLKAYTHKDGWSHDGLIKVAKYYGLEAEKISRASIKKLVNFIDKGYFPIISIKWAFQNNKNRKERLLFWKKYGGHLALVIGYERDKNEIKGFIVNHTSIIPEYNWENKLIPIDMFKKGFTGRAIVVK